MSKLLKIIDIPNISEDVPYKVLNKIDLKQKKMDLNLFLFAHLQTWETYWWRTGGNNPHSTLDDFYGRIYVYLESQDSGSNSSYIRINHYFIIKRVNGAWAGTGQQAYSSYRANQGSLGGTYQTKYGSLDTAGYSNGTTFSRDIGNTYHTVYHNGDGTGRLYVNGSVNISGWTAATSSFNIALPTIPRYANITSFSGSANGLNSIKLNFTADATLDYAMYSLNGGSWLDLPSNNIISGLSPGTYAVKIKVKRADSQLWTESGTINVSTLSLATISNSNVDFDIENGITINFTNPSGKQVDLYIESPNDTTRVTRENITSPYVLELTTDEKNTLYNLAPTSNNLAIRFKLRTDSNNSYVSYKTGTASISNANPVFSNFTYEDTNSTTLALTGDNQTIIKGYSNVKAKVSTSNKMVAQKGATGKEYQLVIGEKQTKANYSAEEDVYLELSAIDNNVFTMYAIDSRNNSTPKIISPETYIDYFKVAKGSEYYNKVSRTNEVEEETTLQLKGIFCNVDFGLVDNSITAKYRYKKAEDSEWSEYNNITLSVDENEWSFNGLIAGDKGANGFTITDNFNIQVLVEDQLSSLTIDLLLNNGEPTLVLDKNGIAVKMFFDGTKKGIQINGDIYVLVDDELVPLVEWEEE